MIAKANAQSQTGQPAAKTESQGKIDPAAAKALSMVKFGASAAEIKSHTGCIVTSAGDVINERTGKVLAKAQRPSAETKNSLPTPVNSLASKATPAKPQSASVVTAGTAIGEMTLDEYTQTVQAAFAGNGTGGGNDSGLPLQINAGLESAAGHGYNKRTTYANKPYAHGRPSYGKNQVEQVWAHAMRIGGGKVYDPTGTEIVWDTTKPRNGQWDMGHIPGEKYAHKHQLYKDDMISKEEFLEWYRDPANYRPELASTNRGHKYE